MGRGIISSRNLPPGLDAFRFADCDEFAALLTRAGLDEVETKTIHWEQPHDGPDALWDAILAGTVRTGPLVRAAFAGCERDVPRTATDIQHARALSHSCRIEKIGRKSPADRIEEVVVGGCDPLPPFGLVPLKRVVHRGISSSLRFPELRRLRPMPPVRVESPLPALWRTEARPRHPPRAR